MNLRRANVDDAMFIYQLRFKDETMRNASWTQTIPTFNDHLEYFLDHLDEYYIISNFHCNNIGFVRNQDTEISIALLPEFRDIGLGTEVLSKLHGKATIKIDNISSYYAFMKAGWRPIGWIMQKEKE